MPFIGTVPAKIGRQTVVPGSGHVSSIDERIEQRIKDQCELSCSTTWPGRIGQHRDAAFREADHAPGLLQASS